LGAPSQDLPELESLRSQEIVVRNETDAIYDNAIARRATHRCLKPNVRIIGTEQVAHLIQGSFVLRSIKKPAYFTTDPSRFADNKAVPLAQIASGRALACPTNAGETNPHYDDKLQLTLAAAAREALNRALRLIAKLHV
jgi:hypothetical protein